MKQLTIRNLDENLYCRLERLAEERDLSLNEAALLLMRRGAGLTVRPHEGSTVGESLVEFIGSWGHEDERDLLESIAVLDQVDESLGK